MKKRLFQIVKVSGTLTLIFVIVPLTIFFAVGYTKATHIFYESELCPGSSADIVVQGNNMHVIYCGSDKIHLEVRDLSGRILEETILSGTDLSGSQVICKDDVPEFVWVDNGLIIHYVNGIQQIMNPSDTAAATQPDLFVANGVSYLVWLENNNLMFKRPGVDDLSQIDACVSDYSVYVHQDEFVYVTYSKIDMIYFRIFSGSIWSEAIEVAPGRNPQYLINDDISYIFHTNAHQELEAFYGYDDNFSLEALVIKTSSVIESLDTHKTVLTWSVSASVYLLQITESGLSNVYFVSDGVSPSVIEYGDNILCWYTRDDSMYYRFMPFPTGVLSEHPTLLDLSDAVTPDDNFIASPREYINAYYGGDWIQVEGVVADWIEEHPFESLIILGSLVTALIITVVSFLTLRKKGDKN